MITKVCLQCGKELVYRTGLFCSGSCLRDCIYTFINNKNKILSSFVKGGGIKFGCVEDYDKKSMVTFKKYVYGYNIIEGSSTSRLYMYRLLYDLKRNYLGRYRLGYINLDKFDRCGYYSIIKYLQNGDKQELSYDNRDKYIPQIIDNGAALFPLPETNYWMRGMRTKLYGDMDDIEEQGGNRGDWLDRELRKAYINLMDCIEDRYVGKGGSNKLIRKWDRDNRDILEDNFNSLNFLVANSSYCSSNLISFFPEYGNRRRVKNKNTSIEIVLQELLNKCGIEFEKHRRVFGFGYKTVPDIFIEPNICIYADGDYWHNLEKAVKRDAYVNEVLKNDGYIVLRFWEHEINKDIDGVWDRIQEVLERRGDLVLSEVV